MTLTSEPDSDHGNSQGGVSGADGGPELHLKVSQAPPLCDPAHLTQAQRSSAAAPRH